MVFVNLKRVDLERNLVSDYAELLVFLCEYMIAYMLVPGVVEKWAVFFDMGNEWVNQMTISDF
jgi:hypothetical protein